jgi:hypothetical protein
VREMRNTYKILFGELNGRWDLKRLRRKWMDDTKMEIGYDSVNWI